MATATSKLIGELLIKARLDTTAVRTGMQPGITAMGELDGSAEKLGTRGSGNLMQFSIAASVMAATVGAAFKGIVDQFIEFDRKMSIVRSVTDASSNTFAQMSEKVRELGATTEFGAAKAAEAMLIFARIGYNTKEIFDLLTPTVKLAASQQSDFAETANLVSATIKAYHLETSEADRVTNLFAATSSKTAADLDKLIISMQYIAPIAKATGISVEETNAALGMLFNAGMKASRAGTSLRYAIGALLSPLGRAKDAIKSLGLDVTKLDPSSNKLNDVIKELSKSFASGKKPTKEFVDIFGRRASASMLTLAETVYKNNDAFSGMVDRISNTNEATRQFEQQMDTISGQFLRIKALVQEMAIGIGESLTGAFKLFGDILEEVLIGFKELPMWFKSMIGYGGLAVTAITSLVAIFASLKWMIGTISVALKGLFAEMTIATGGWFALAAAVAFAITKLLSYIGAQKKLTEQMDEQKKKAYDLATKLLDLEKEMNVEREKGGKNSDISFEKEQRYQRMLHELVKIYPDLINYQNKEAGILKLKDGALEGVIASLGKEGDAAENNLKKATDNVEKLKREHLGLQEQIGKVNTQLETRNSLLNELKTGTKIGEVRSATEYEQAAAEVPGLEKEKIRLNEELVDKFKELTAAQNALHELSKTAVVDAEEYEIAIDNLDESFGRFNGGLQDFLEKMGAARAEFAREMELIGKKGYSLDAKELQNSEIDLKNSLTKKYNILEKSINRELAKGEKSWITKKQGEMILSKALIDLNNATFEATALNDAKKEDLDKKYSENYVNIMQDIAAETNRVIDETNATISSSYSQRLQALKNAEDAEIRAVNDAADKELQNFVGSQEDTNKLLEEYSKLRNAIDKKYAEKRYKEQVEMATKSIDIINQVVSGAIGELMGLDDTARQVFSSMASMITNLVSGNVAGALVSVASLIATSILNARKEQEKLEEERRKAAAEAIKATIELRKEWRSFSRDIGSINNSVEDLVNNIRNITDELIEKVVEEITAAGFDASEYPEFIETIRKSAEADAKGFEALMDAYNVRQDIANKEFNASSVESAAFYRKANEDASAKLSASINKFSTEVGVDADMLRKAVEKLAHDDGVYDDYFKKVKAAAAVIDVMRGKTFDAVSEFDDVISAMKENSKAVLDNGFSAQSAADMIEMAGMRYDKAMEAAGDDPAAIQAAQDSWNNLMDWIKSQPTLWDQLDVSAKNAINEQIKDMGDKWKDGIEDIIGELKDLFSNYADSFDDSFGTFSKLYDQGIYSLKNYLAGLDEFSRSISDDIPKDIADGIRSSIEDLKLDAVVAEITRVKDELTKIGENLKTLGSTYSGLQAKQADLTKQKEFITNKTVPKNFEYIPEIIAEGLTPAMQIAKIYLDTGKSIKALDKQTQEWISNLLDTKDELKNWKNNWIAELTEMYKEMDEERTNALESSQEKQNEIMGERHRLMTDFAFAESQNERSNRMRSIRELDANLEKEQRALDKQLAEIEKKRKESQIRINEEWHKTREDLIDKIAKLEEDIAANEEKRAEELASAHAEAGAIRIKTNQELQRLNTELAVVERTIEGIHAQILQSLKDQKDITKELMDLQGIRNELAYEQQNRLVSKLMLEGAIRQDIVNNILSLQIQLQTSLNLLTTKQLNDLKAQRDVWSDINSIIGDSVNMINGSETKMKLNAMKNNMSPPGLPLGSYPILLQSGGITNTDMPAILHKNEAVIPLSKLPDMMNRLTGRMPINGGRNVIVNINDTIDLSHSISSMNSANDVDKLYRNIILPAKKRNMERYRNTVLKDIV